MSVHVIVTAQSLEVVGNINISLLCLETNPDSWVVQLLTYSGFLRCIQPDAPMCQIILVWNGTRHVSNGLSVHHQQLKTVHTGTGICQTDTALCFLVSRQQYQTKQTAVSISLTYACCCMCSLELLMMDRKTI